MSFWTKVGEGKNYRLVSSPKLVSWLFNSLKSVELCAIDIETSHRTSLPMAGQRDVVVGGISFSWQKDQGAYLPLYTGRGQETWWKRDDVFDAILDRLEGFLSGPCEKVGQNAKFDVGWLYRAFGIATKNVVFDTMLAHHLLDEEGRLTCRHGLKPMAKYYLDPLADRYEKELQSALEHYDPVHKRYTEVDLEILYPYACSDADYTLQLMHIFEPQLEAQGLLDLFYDTVMPLQHVCMLAEVGGMSIDMEKNNELSAMYAQRRAELQPQIYASSGFQFDISSPQQVADVLYNRLGLPVQFGKKGQISTDKEALEILKDKHPCVALLHEFRSIEKLDSGYVEGVRKRIDPADGKLHPTFLIHGTVTGRISSEDPNCFDGQTEVLTPQGWVRFDTLKPGVKVAQWDAGQIEFVEPISYVRRVHVGKMIRLFNQHTRLLVTPDHRCLLKHRRSGKLKVFEAAEYPSDYKQLHAGLYEGSGELVIDDADLFLTIATQADGYFRENTVEFAFHKQRKIDRMRQLLDVSGTEYHEHPYNYGGYSRVKFRIKRGRMTELIYSLLSEKKVFGPWLLKLPTRQLDLFCSEVFFWDGCWTRKTNYASQVEVNTDWVQTIMALRGKRVHKRLYATPHGPSYQVDVCHNVDYSFTTNIEKSEVQFSGEVFCVSVPSSFLLVRREGQICVTGNCQNWPRPEHGGILIKSMFVAGEDHKIVLSDFSQIELVGASHCSKEPAWVEAFKNGADVHSQTAIKCFNLTCPVEDVKKLHEEKRSFSKTVNFGILYGMSAYGLAPRLKMTVEEAQAFIEQYFSGLPVLKQWIEDTHELARRQGYVVNPFGRRRRLPDIQLSVPKRLPKPNGAPYCFGNKHEAPPIIRVYYPEFDFEHDVTLLSDVGRLQSLAHDLATKQHKLQKCTGCPLIAMCVYEAERSYRQSLVNEAKRQAVNSIVQSFASDMTSKSFSKILMVCKHNGIPISVDNAVPGIRPWNTVHDELAFCVHDRYVEQASKIIEDVMTHIFPECLVPIKVDLAVVNRLSDKHEKH